MGSTQTGTKQSIFILCRYILNHKYVEESDLESEVMVPTKEAKMIIYDLMENSFVQLQELKKTVSASVPGKSVYLYHCNLETVVRAQLARTHLALANTVVRGWAEADTQARLLDKQERVEVNNPEFYLFETHDLVIFQVITASVQASGGSEEQLADIGEMMSPLEQETVQGVRRRLAALHQATILASQDGLLLQLFLNSKKK